MRLLTNGQKLIAAPRTDLVAKFAANYTIGFILCIPLSVLLCAPAPAFQVGYTIWTYCGHYAPIATAIAAFAVMVVLWLCEFWLGRATMSLITQLGVGPRKQALTPLFLGTSTFLAWGALAVLVFTLEYQWIGFIIGNIFVFGGIVAFFLGQRQGMKSLRNTPDSKDSTVNIECSPGSGAEFIDRLFALKNAESSEHLEQLSKQCLVLIKPAAAVSSVDCTAALINELMKRKLNMEADELSSLQLKLIDEQTSA